MLRRSMTSTALVAGCISAAVVAFGSAAVAQDFGSGDFGSSVPVGFPCVSPTVYRFPLLNWGWFSLDGSNPEFVTGPPQAPGDGSLDMTASAGDRVNYYHRGDRTSLDDVAASATNLGFMHQGQYVAFHLRIRDAERADGDRSGFTTLVWWPSANNMEGATDWVSSTRLVEGQWWSTQAIAGLAGGQGDTATLQEIADANPRAFVTEYGVQNDDGVGGADDIVFGCTRWNFEPGPGSGSGS
ncbi:hypothetical protein [Nocardia aurea]|uniref:hypothetical protein n=1 Tax=Nocardia aurea TaxID=2144174 RepID=UPI0033A9FBC2